MWVRRSPMTDRRPLIAIPARFSASASALRYRAEVTARTLIESVYAAGGEPVVVHPCAPHGAVDQDEVRDRLAFADAILLPGGGDVSSRWTGTGDDPSMYDVDEEQDAFDLALARVALADGRPLLSVCRGMQIVNVALGGTLVADMTRTSAGDHRHRVHGIDVEADTPLARIVGTRTTISCYHHQCLDRLADGLRVAATADDGVVEAVTLDGATGWYLGVQWHPEDTSDRDLSQAAVFQAFVAAARA